MVLYRMLKYTKYRYMYTAIDIVSFPYLFEMGLGTSVLQTRRIYVRKLIVHGIYVLNWLKTHLKYIHVLLYKLSPLILVYYHACNSTQRWCMLCKMVVQSLVHITGAC